MKVICQKCHESELHTADFFNFSHFGLGSKIGQKTYIENKIDIRVIKVVLVDLTTVFTQISAGGAY